MSSGNQQQMLDRGASRMRTCTHARVSTDLHHVCDRHAVAFELDRLRLSVHAVRKCARSLPLDPTDAHRLQHLYSYRS